MSSNNETLHFSYRHISGLNTVFPAILHDSAIIIADAACMSTACMVNVPDGFFGCIIEGK